jgi:signal recognition particle subunit SEC65
MNDINATNLEKLREIKGIVEVHESSLENLIVLIALLLLGVLVLGGVFYFYKNRRRRRKRPTPKEVALERLRNINYQDTKEVAYTFSTDGYLWIDEQSEEEFRDIEKELIAYKYKKEIPELTDELKAGVKKFIEEIK